MVNCSPLAPFCCTVPPLIVPATRRIEPVAGEKVSVVPVLVSVPVRLTLPPKALSSVPSAESVKVPPKFTVLAASATRMVPALLQLAVLIDSVLPVFASSRPVLLIVPPLAMVRVLPLLALIDPLLLKVPLLLMVSVRPV